MRHLFIRICFLLLFISSIGIVEPQKALAASDLTLKSFCSIGNTEYAWGGSGVIHPNGLLYIAKTISPISQVTTKAYMAIYAIDPNSAGTMATPGLCTVVDKYLDIADNWTSVSALLDPTVIAKDAQGNLYAGKSTYNSYRLLYIPSSAPANSPFQGIVLHNITYGNDGSRKPNASFSALGVTNDHAMISMFAWNDEPFNLNYAIIPTAKIKDNSIAIINDGIWRVIPNAKTGLLDSIVGMPDGRFFVAGYYESGVGASFVNPVTGVLTNAFDQTKSGVGYVDCRPRNLPFTDIYSCAGPTAAIGADKNLYFTAGITERGDEGRAVVAWRYDPIANQWYGLGNLPKPTLIPGFNLLDSIGGAQINADIDGNVLAIKNGWKTKTSVLTLLNKTTSIWSVSTPNPKYQAFGKPDLNYILSEGTARISTVLSIAGKLYWYTFTAPINITSIDCNPNVVIETGNYYVNKTSVSGTIYTADTCKASRYVAAVSVNATPVDPPTVPIKSFSPNNGNFSVSGLVEGLNYVHVRLYDATTALEKWITKSVYVDTNATVQASVTLQNGNDTSNYKDNWSMRASSYTASGYTRSSIGTIHVTGITDPSGLASYAINDQPAVSFDTNNINKPIPVNFNSITSTVGISLTLTDGAGNTEVRGIRPLIYDITPPDASSAPSASLTAAAGVFSGTIGLSGGTITDNLYSASGRQYWGVWVANAKCIGDVVGGCPTDTASQLRWGAVPVTDPTTIPWNLLHGLNQVPSSGLYRTYIRFLDGAGNASTAAVTVDTTVTMTTNKIYIPLNFSQR